MVQKISLFIRQYSTLIPSGNNSNPDDINNNQPIKFDSLEQACEQIKYSYIGVSGVYKLTNINDLSRFYIGSSNNLARRMEEYNKLTKGLRTPHSASELEISKTPASEWRLEFLYITAPQLSLVYEQYAILTLKPTININFKVIPRVNPQWKNNLDNAISVIENLLSLFIEGSEGYNRLNVFLQTFKTAKNLKFEDQDIDNRYYCFLVFLYDINSPNKNPIIYSSMKRAIKGLQISYSTLLDLIENKYIYKSNFILSFEPIGVDTFGEYAEKLAFDNQLRKHITVYNLDNEIVAEFKSAREMSKHLKVDPKVVRAAIAKGEYQDFLLLIKNVQKSNLCI